MSNVFYRLHKRRQQDLKWACSAHHLDAAGAGMSRQNTAKVAPRQVAVQFEERLKKMMILLLLSGCAPQPGQYSFYYHSYSGHYADDYTYTQAQGTLDRFCALSPVDINRILRSDPERAAKDVICQRDSLNRESHDKTVHRFQAELAQEVAKQVAKEAAMEAAKEVAKEMAKKGNINITRSEKIEDPRHYNASSPNTEGGSNVYIDVDHGHAESKNDEPLTNPLTPAR